MKTYLISIIIAAYNEEKYIETCLHSLTQQDYPHIEIIVVDDGSSDKTVDRIAYVVSHVKQIRQIELIQLNHQGTAIARNTAAKAAKGNILVFLDADMNFEKDFIRKLVSPIVENKTKGTFSKLEYVKNWNKALARCWNRNNNPPLPDTLRVPQDIELGDDFRAILKSEFLRVGGFDNTGYTDTWTLHQKLGYRPTNAPDAQYYHYNPESLSEIFHSARWIGRRRYKLGRIGTTLTIFKRLPIFSLFRGVTKSIQYHELSFIPFFFAYDWGILNGALSSLLGGEVRK